MSNLSAIAKRAIRLPRELRARARDRRLARREHHYLSICAIFRNEAAMLREWLPFHLGVGVGHFYLYDNGSDDASREIIEPYRQRGLVTLTDWPVNPGQIPAYRHCANTFADETRWVAFIDLDEFLFSPQQRDLRPILAEYERFAGIGVHSFYFGSAGQRQPVESALRSFVRRADDRINFKSIANPRWIRRFDSVHFFSYWGPQYEGVAYYNWRRDLLYSPKSTKISDPAKLRINHYWSRSLDELAGRKPFRSAVYGTPRDHLLAQWLEAEQHMNAVEDRTILRFSQIGQVPAPACI